MLRTFTVVVLLHLLFLPALLCADDFSAFRIPRHQILTARTSVFGSYNGSDGGHSTAGQSYASDQSNLQSELRAYGSWLHDSDPLRLELELFGVFSSQTSNYRNSQFYSVNETSSHQSQRQKQLLENYQLNAGTRIYPWTLPFGLDVSLGLNGNDGQNWDTRYARSTDTLHTSRDYNNSESWNFSYRAKGSASLGVGRVRDASTVYEVYALEERLQSGGVLTRPLLSATRQRLIDLIYIAGDYGRVHERPARFFWRELESALNEDGGLRVEGLDAYSLYRIAEPVFGRYAFYSPYSAYADVDPVPVPRSRGGFPAYVLASGPSRTAGWFVGPTVQASHYHRIQRIDLRQSTEEITADSAWIAASDHNSERRTSASDGVAFGVRGEYHRPFGLRWQFDADSRLTHPYDDQLNIKRNSFQLSSRAALTRFILDRWLFTVTVSHQRYDQTSRQPDGAWLNNNSWNLNTSAELHYYVEDHLSVSLSAGQSQSHQHSSGNGRSFNRNYDVLLGLTYQLTGRLSAPGTAAPTTIFD